MSREYLRAWSRIVLTTVFILLSNPAQAAEAPPSTSAASAGPQSTAIQVNLTEAVRLALRQNNSLKAGASGLAAAAADVRIARSNLLPTVTLEERAMRTNSPTYGFMAKLNQERFSMDDFAIPSLNDPDPSTDFQASIAMQQPLFAPAALIGLGMQEHAYRAEQDTQARRQEDIAQQVATTFFHVLTAREFLQVADTALADAREHQRLAQVRFDAGTGLYSDVLRAETAVHAAEQQRVTSSNRLETARRTLGLLMGTDQAVEPAGEITPVTLQEKASYAEAVLQRRDIRALEAQQQAARQAIALSRSAYLPTVGLGSSYQLNDHDTPFEAEGNSWMIMALMRWEIFSGARTGSEVNKAGHQAAALSENLQGLKLQVQFQVDEAYQAVTEARKNLELAAAAVKSAEEGARLVQMRYENALATMVDLLDAQVALDRARADLAARMHQEQLAILNLGHVSGTILADLGIQNDTEETQ